MTWDESLRATAESLLATRLPDLLHLPHLKKKKSSVEEESLLHTHQDFLLPDLLHLLPLNTSQKKKKKTWRRPAWWWWKTTGLKADDRRKLQGLPASPNRLPSRGDPSLPMVLSATSAPFLYAVIKMS
jgi:hypothetical protein